MPFDRKHYMKTYNKKYKESRKESTKEYNKEYQEKNKDILKEKRQTEKYKKSRRIRKWKSRGIIFFDYDLLYDIFYDTTNCDLCGVELIDGKKSNSRCLDHDHRITDYDNVRYVLCHRCNNNHDKKPRDWKKRKEYNKKYKKELYAYRTSWGGDLKGDNCNLLKIDVSLFD